MNFTQQNGVAKSKIKSNPIQANGSDERLIVLLSLLSYPGRRPVV